MKIMKGEIIRFEYDTGSGNHEVGVDYRATCDFNIQDELDVIGDTPARRVKTFFIHNLQSKGLIEHVQENVRTICLASNPGEPFELKEYPNNYTHRLEA